MAEHYSDLISLSEFIQQIKTDLAPREEQDTPLFYIEHIELEVQVVAGREQGGKAGIKLSILGFEANAGVDTKNTQAHTQKLKVILSPVVSKDKLLQNMPLDEKTRVEQNASKRVMRGSKTQSK